MKVTAFTPFVRGRSMCVIGVSALFLLTACMGIDEMRWREQVWLHDGQFIHIDRHATATKSGFPDSRRGNVLSQEIRYDPMQVLWTTNGSDEVPISFELIDGSAYLVANAPYSREKFCVGKSKGEYVAVFYRWTNGKKKTITQQETPIDRMGNNVSGISQWGYDKKSDRTYMSWSEVADETGQRRAGPPVSLTKFFKKRSWLRCK